MTSKNGERPVSPLNGQPLPRGKPFVAGDERAANAGRRSGKSRNARKTLREELLALLTESDDTQRTAQARMSTALIQQAVKGNTKAFEIIRDTIGEKPVETVAISTTDFSALDDAFHTLAGDHD